MTYDGYRTLFIVAAIISAVMLVITVLLFIFLKIPSVIGDLSGSTARKAIKKIREQNEQSGDKSYQASGYNVQRGKLTDKITPSGNIVKNSHGDFGGMNTSKISTAVLSQQAMESQQTTVLESNATETTVLSQQTNETTVLDSNASSQETVPLQQGSFVNNQVQKQPIDYVFAIEYDITYVHSNEVVS